MALRIQDCSYPTSLWDQRFSWAPCTWRWYFWLFCSLSRNPGPSPGPGLNLHAACCPHFLYTCVRSLSNVYETAKIIRRLLEDIIIGLRAPAVQRHPIWIGPEAPIMLLGCGSHVSCGFFWMVPRTCRSSRLCCSYMHGEIDQSAHFVFCKSRSCGFKLNRMRY
jgi:hypothetical protein